MDGNELLDTLREDILKDTNAPYMWSDRRLVQLLNQAYMDFAEATLILRDSTSDSASFTLTAGETQYPFGEEVLAIMSAKIEGTSNNLKRFGDNELNSEDSPGDSLAWLETINSTYLQAGEPRAFTTNDSLRIITVYPTPTVAEEGMVIRMRIARLPLVQLSLDNLGDEIELPRNLVLGLTHGAAAIAYTDQDSDGGDAAKAKVQKDKFAEYIDRGKKAVRRTMFQPLTWGFGKAGFGRS
jgi:hypothetical protein